MILNFGKTIFFQIIGILFNKIGEQGNFYDSYNYMKLFFKN